MRYLVRRVGFLLVALWAALTLNFLRPVLENVDLGEHPQHIRPVTIKFQGFLGQAFRFINLA